MSVLNSVVWFLAETAPAAGKGEESTPFTIWPLLAVIMVLFYIMVIRPQKNKERDFKSLVANLKKNDRVVTIGGIHGVVISVQRDADRVTLRIDESTGTTIRIGTGAVSRVLNDEKNLDSDRQKA